MAKKTAPEKTTETTVQGVDLAGVERLLDFMQKHGLEEFEYERKGVHVRLRKASTNPPAAGRTSQAAAHEAGPSKVETPRPASSGTPAAEADLHIIKSPIVGTYYSSASPGAAPYVTVGAHVEPGQVLCIIEAMKLMNEIESDIAGEVVRILAETGKPVEYGEPLFGIRPQRKRRAASHAPAG
ncbi:MAG: acetyl-CoA carboxylase biotin carboxyl carrier protein [Candidatus Acidiferrales bacterium]